MLTLPTFANIYYCTRQAVNSLPMKKTSCLKVRKCALSNRTSFQNFKKSSGAHILF